MNLQFSCTYCILQLWRRNNGDVTDVRSHRLDGLVESLRFLKMNTVFVLNIVASCFTVAMSVQLYNGYYFVPQTASLWYEIIIIIIIIIMGQNSIVGIATCYGLDGPGIESNLQCRGY